MDLDRHAQRVRQYIFVNANYITANGQPVAARLPCTIEEFWSRKPLPRSVVVEHNGRPSRRRNFRAAVELGRPAGDREDRGGG